MKHLLIFFKLFICHVGHSQGDQIVRILGNLLGGNLHIIFGQLFENYRSSVNFRDTLCINNFDKNGLGYILGNSFANSSGRPGPQCLHHIICLPKPIRFGFIWPSSYLHICTHSPHTRVARFFLTQITKTVENIPNN
jgi:hypothetical protein